MDNPAVDVDFMSLSPKIIRFRGMLSAKECALFRLLMLEAVIYLGDFSSLVASRPGAVNSSSGFGALATRPLIRAQSAEHISFYFKDPPEFMLKMLERISTATGVHPNNAEPIFHLYVPQQVPANLHLDNFNKFLFPHRFLSVSLFLDDYEDGGTVFPLLLDEFGHGDTGGSTPLAQHDDVQHWQRVLNDERLRPVNVDLEAYAHRRVDSNDEPLGFRGRLLEATRKICREGRASQMPVVPEKGTMYLWFNYLENGEDDVRSLHAGCSSSVSYKMLGAIFLRDGPGPFREHDSFWHPSQPRQRQVDETQRQVEMLTVNAFRFDHIAALFDLERSAVFELFGGAEAVKLARFHYEYSERLLEAHSAETSRSHLHGMIQKHGFQDQVPWFAHSAESGQFF